MARMNAHAGQVSKGYQMYDGIAAIDDARRDPRTHILLVATLYFDHRIVPVRVRNLSPQGALLEGVSLPPPGKAVVLRRGKLEAAGRVVRSTAGKAGMQFDHPIYVHAWLPVKGSPAQRSVDSFAALVENCEAATMATHAPKSQSRAEIASELRSLQLGLISLGDTLSDDRILVATHPEVQFLDSAAQRIAKLIEALEMSPGGRTTF